MPINIERFNLLAIEVPDRFEDAVIAKIVKVRLPCVFGGTEEVLTMRLWPVLSFDAARAKRSASLAMSRLWP